MNNVKLLTHCSFTNVFEQTEYIGQSAIRQPIKKVGHIRGYYRNGEWYAKYFCCHKALETDAAISELKDAYSKLLKQEEFMSLTSINEFCHLFPEAKVKQSFNEYNFFIEGAVCDYWLRINLAEGDYNLYLHAYEK